MSQAVGRRRLAPPGAGNRDRTGSPNFLPCLASSFPRSSSRSQPPHSANTAFQSTSTGVEAVANFGSPTGPLVTDPSPRSLPGAVTLSWDLEALDRPSPRSRDRSWDRDRASPRSLARPSPRSRDRSRDRDRDRWRSLDRALSRPLSRSRIRSFDRDRASFGVDRRRLRRPGEDRCSRLRPGSRECD